VEIFWFSFACLSLILVAILVFRSVSVHSVSKMPKNAWSDEPMEMKRLAESSEFLDAS